jgi:hypothetical protein
LTENESITRSDAGQSGTESPVESPVGVPPLSAKRSFVYVLECEGFVKIGYAHDPIYRTTVHQVGNPFQINLVGYAEYPSRQAAEAAENRALAAFREQRSRGEWHAADANEVLTYVRRDAGELPRPQRRPVPSQATVGFDYQDYIDGLRRSAALTAGA